MGQRSSAPPFDTQQAVEELIAAGMPPDQASVIVRLHLRWANRDFATGKDIDRLQAEIDRVRQEIGQEFSRLREEIDHKLNVQRSALETKITRSSADTIRWVTGSQIGTAAIYLAALLAAIKL